MLSKTCFLGVLPILAGFVLGCTRAADPRSTIVVSFPRLANSKSEAPIKKSDVSVQNATGSTWNPINPTSLSQITCFGVSVGSADESLGKNRCYKLDKSFEFKTGPTRAAIAPNQSIEIEVPAGRGREVRIFGFYAASEADCVDLKGTGTSTSSKLSRPYIIGERTVDLTPGENRLEIQVSFDSQKFIERCEGPEFPGSTDGVAPTPPPTSVPVSSPTHLRIERNEFPFNAVTDSSCSKFVGRVTDPSGYSVGAQANVTFSIDVNAANASIYSSMNQCNSSSNPATTSSIASGASEIEFYLRMPSRGTEPTVSIVPVSIVGGGLQGVGLLGLSNKSTSATTLTFEGPRTLVPEVCYPFKLAHRYYPGWTASGEFSATVAGTGGAKLYSNSICTTETTSVYVTGTGSGDLFVKLMSGASQPTVSASGSTAEPNTETLQVGRGSAQVTQLAIEGDSSQNRDSCSSAPLRVVTKNALGETVPISTSSLNVSIGGTDIAVWGNGCGVGVDPAIPVGSYALPFYVKPSAAGILNLNANSAGIASANRNLTVNGLYRLDLAVTESSPVANGTCVEVTVSPRNFDGSAASFSANTSVSFSPAARLYSQRINGTCTQSAAGLTLNAGATSVTAYVLLENAVDANANVALTATATGVNPGNASVTLTAPPAISLLVAGTQNIAAEYPFYLEKALSLFAGLPTFTYAQTSGAGSLTGSVFSPPGSGSANFTITDARTQSVAVATNVVSRSASLSFMSSLPSGASLTRSSAASFYDSAGVLTLASSGAPRFDHNPDPATSFQPLGLLVEGATTNLLPRSEEFATAPWDYATLSGAPSPTGAPNSPRGSTTGVYLLNDANSNTFNVERVWHIFSSQLTDDVDFIASVYMKANAGSGWAGMMINENGVGAPGTGSSGVVINLATGDVYPMEGPYTPQFKFAHGAQKLANGWYRVWVKYHSGNYTGAGGQGSLVIFPAHSDSGNLSGDIGATGSIWVFGAQVEQASSMSSYIATTSAAAARAADIVTMPINGTNIAGYSGSSSGTFRAQIHYPLQATGLQGTLMQLCGASCTSDSVTSLRTTAGLVQVQTLIGGMIQASVDSRHPLPSGVVTALGLSWLNSGSLNLGLAGDSRTSGGTFAAPNLNSGAIYFGNNDTQASPVNLHLRTLEYWTQALSAPALGSATQNP